MNKYIVEEKTLLKLVTAYYKLQALEAGGVDNWSYYGDSLYDFLKEVISCDEDEDEDYSFDIFAEEMLRNFGELLIGKDN